MRFIVVQQFGKILEQGLQQVWKYINSPAVKRQFINSAKGYYLLNHTYIEKQVETTIKQVWISITSTKITIKEEEKEVEFIKQTIEKRYSIGNVKNSNVFQGENIVVTNNYSIHFNLYGNNAKNIEEIRNMLKNLKEESFKQGNSSLVRDEIHKINNSVYIHGENIQEIAYLTLQITPNL
jgi:hypothetical protein